MDECSLIDLSTLRKSHSLWLFSHFNFSLHLYCVRVLLFYPLGYTLRKKHPSWPWCTASNENPKETPARKISGSWLELFGASMHHSLSQLALFNKFTTGGSHIFYCMIFINIFFFNSLLVRLEPKLYIYIQSISLKSDSILFLRWTMRDVWMWRMENESCPQVIFWQGISKMFLLISILIHPQADLCYKKKNCWKRNMTRSRDICNIFTRIDLNIVQSCSNLLSETSYWEFYSTLLWRNLYLLFLCCCVVLLILRGMMILEKSWRINVI